MDSSPRTDPGDAAGFAPLADALRASEARYRALATASADVIYRMSPDWREMRRLDGRGFLADTAEPTEAWLEQYILPEDRAQVMAVIEEAIRGKHVFELEHRVVRADGTAGWTFSRAVPLLDDAGEIVEWIGTASDITTRKEVEGALHRSEARLRRMMNVEGVGVFLLDEETGTLLDANDAFLRMTGRTREQVEARALDWRMLTPEEYVAVSEAQMDNLRAHGRIGPYEKEYLRSDGSRSWLLFAGASLGDGTAVEYCIDVNDRRRAEAAAEIERVAHDRDALRRQLVQGEEEERRRLARELHDEAGQHLTALGLGLQALSNVAPPGSEIDRRTTELRELANTLALELHAIAVRLRPRALDDFGLEAALGAYTEEWSRHSGIEVDLHATVGASRLPNAVETALYRVVQEALTNVARHSGARHAGIVVERRSGHVIAVVEDDGHGFRAPDAPPLNGQGMDAAGLGLLGIRERVALLGGTLDVESSPGSGTTLFVRIPLADAAGEAVKAP